MEKRMPRKGVLWAVAVVAALLALVGVYCLYFAYHPHIYITRPTPGPGQTEEDFDQRIRVATSEHLGIPMASSVERELMALCDWNDQIDAELSTYTQPYHIEVSGQLAGGQVTLRYDGYVTTPDGVTSPYRQERTFDLPIRAREFDLS